MIANQKLVASDGYEVCLFPLEYLEISQGEYGSTSHQGTLNIDFRGWGPNGRVYGCNYYAPCTCKLVNSTIDTASNMRVWESVDKVHLPDGTLDYICWQVGHDNNPPYSTVGTVIQQGDLMGHTGTAGFVTGDHLHYNVARGHFVGGQRVPPANQYQLINSMHIYDANYVNDTVIVNGLNYNWRTYDGGITPPTPTKTGNFLIMYNTISNVKRKEVNLWRQ